MKVFKKENSCRKKNKKVFQKSNDGATEIYHHKA